MERIRRFLDFEVGKFTYFFSTMHMMFSDFWREIGLPKILSS